jgi:O-methyltransferase
MRLSDRLYLFLDRTSRRIHPGLLRLVAMPINYQNKSKDNLIYESARMLDIAFAYSMNNKTRGAYAEFGVFQGRTFVEAWRSASRYGFRDIDFWAFDSFEGLPEIAGTDLGGPFVKGEFSCTRKQFESNLARFGFDMARLRIVEGYYDKTLREPNVGSIELEKVAVAWIDCDLYESTVPVLEFLTDRLANGAILIFDDWFCFNGSSEKGEQLACAEWLAANPDIQLVEYQNYHAGGKSFIVNRR